MDRVLHGAYRSLGRRGLALLIASGIFFFVGVGNLLVDDGTELARQLSLHGYRLATLTGITITGWGYIFMGISVGCAIVAFSRRGYDIYGFIVLSCASALWSCVYFVGWALFGADRNWVGGILFAGVALLLLVISGWAEDPEYVND